jgi:hypothetical protein
MQEARHAESPARYDTGSAKYDFTVHAVQHLFGRERHVMLPFALEISAGDFAFAADHRRIAISLLAGTLNSAAPFSMAAASSGASTMPSRSALAASFPRPQSVREVFFRGRKRDVGFAVLPEPAMALGNEHKVMGEVGDAFGGAGVDGPGRGLRRFWLLGHAGSIGHVQSADRAPALAEAPRSQGPGPHGARSQFYPTHQANAGCGSGVPQAP